jgi:hypothetical protein
VAQIGAAIGREFSHALLASVARKPDDIFGDGVNIAVRLEGIAEPGGVCISDDAHRQIRGKVDVAFDDMGSQSLKNRTLSPVVEPFIGHVREEIWMDVTVEEMEKRVARWGKVKPYEQTFIESRLPGFEKRLYKIINRGVLENKGVEAAGQRFAEQALMQALTHAAIPFTLCGNCRGRKRPSGGVCGVRPGRSSVRRSS